MSSYNDQDLIKAVADSISIGQVISKLNLKCHGGSYNLLNREIKRLNLDISHFKGKLWRQNIGPIVEIEDYLLNKKFIKSNPLKLKLINNNILVNKCSKCGIIDWLGEKITLELHHIDGNKRNNNIENLTILCPNCHSQTDNYRSKNSKRKPKTEYKKRTNKLIKCSIDSCDQLMRIEATQCRKCYQNNKKTKIFWPSTEELLDMLKKSSFNKVAKDLGVTTSTLIKRIKNHPIAKEEVESSNTIP